MLTPFELSRKREEFMIFGIYPGLIGFPDPAEKADALVGLANDYLCKDILSLEIDLVEESGGLSGGSLSGDQRKRLVALPLDPVHPDILLEPKVGPQTA